MVKGRDDEALKIIKDGAKYNKATLPPDEQIKASHIDWISLGESITPND